MTCCITMTGCRSHSPFPSCTSDWSTSKSKSKVVASPSGTSKPTHMRAQVKAAFRDLRDQSRLPPTLGLSIGCAEVSPEATEMASVVREADERMYEDRVGRDRGPASHSSSPKA